MSSIVSQIDNTKVAAIAAIANEMCCHQEHKHAGTCCSKPLAKPKAKSKAKPKAKSDAEQKANPWDGLNLPKRLILPSFVSYRTLTVTEVIKTGKKKGKKVRKQIQEFGCNCNGCKQNTRSPVFHDEQSLMNHVESQRENRGFKWYVCTHCVDKGFETYVPATPGSNFAHLKRYHKYVLRDLGIDHKKGFSKVFWCFDCQEHSTFQHKHCFKCPKEGGGFLAFKDKKELDEHLRVAHPLPIVKASDWTVTGSKGSRKKYCGRKKVIDLGDRDAISCVDSCAQSEAKAKAKKKPKPKPKPRPKADVPSVGKEVPLQGAWAKAEAEE